MKIILFCEGWTEKGALLAFLRRWLDSQLPQRVGVHPVGFNGWPELVKDSPMKAKLYFQRPDVIAVVALLDLYGPTFYPETCTTADDRHSWGKSKLEAAVGDQRFRQYFAVHEVEAWILSQPELLPNEVRKKLPTKAAQPETVNFTEPPSHLLERLYTATLSRSYKKRTYGDQLFRDLDQAVVHKKCPYFAKMADELVTLAKSSLGIS